MSHVDAIEVQWVSENQFEVIYAFEMVKTHELFWKNICFQILRLKTLFETFYGQMYIFKLPIDF